MSSLGSTTETDLTLDCSSGCVIATVTPRPSAADVLPSAVAVSAGLNGSRSQPVAPVGVTASLVTNCPGASCESADRVVVCGPAQRVGSVRNGVGGALLGPPRSASWAGSAGTPQKVSVELTRFEFCAMSLIVKNRPRSPRSRSPPMMSVRGAMTGTENAKSASPSGPTSML